MKYILVVEDEFGLAESVKLLLEYEGYRVNLASNGREALAAIAVDVPDLIISDYIMPIATGAALGRELRGSSEWRDIPLVMTTSVEEATLRREFDGYDGFLRKPYSARQLIALVARLLGVDGGARR